MFPPSAKQKKEFEKKMTISMTENGLFTLVVVVVAAAVVVDGTAVDVAFTAMGDLVVVTERAGGEGRFSTQHLIEFSEHVTFSKTFSQRRAANTWTHLPGQSLLLEVDVMVSKRPVNQLYYGRVRKRGR